MQNRRIVSLSLLAVATLAACEVCPFESKRHESRREPAAGLTQLTCTTHNGPIEVHGVAGATEVGIEVDITARGATDADAQQHLALLQIAVERKGSELTITGLPPKDFAGDWNAQFSFRLQVPAELAATLLSHNGAIDVDGVRGALGVTSHNGALHVVTEAAAIALETHNGGIDVELVGDGPVGGKIQTHNGGVDVHLGQRAALVTATTGNGRVTAVDAYAVRSRRADSIELEAGHGGGTVVVETHNGNVAIR